MSRNISKLSSNNRISNTNQYCGMQSKSTTTKNKDSCFHHSRIQNSWVSLYLKASISFDLHISTWHLVSLNSNIVQGHPTIVFATITKFRSHVSSFNSRQMLMSVSTSYLHYKRSDSIIIHSTIIFRNQNFCKY